MKEVTDHLVAVSPRLIPRQGKTVPEATFSAAITKTIETSKSPNIYVRGNRATWGAHPEADEQRHVAVQTCIVQHIGLMADDSAFHMQMFGGWDNERSLLQCGGLRISLHWEVWF